MDSIDGIELILEASALERRIFWNKICIKERETFEYPRKASPEKNDESNVRFLKISSYFRLNN